MNKSSENAPVIAKGEIEINADPDTIWDVLVDIKNWPRWNPDIKSASLEGDVAEGSKFRWKARSISITSIFQDVDKPRLLGWTGKTMGIKAIHIWKLEPIGGVTLVRTEESWKGPFTRLMKGSAHDMLQKSLDSGLKYLKQEVEKTSP